MLCLQNKINECHECNTYKTRLMSVTNVEKGFTRN